jgi:hypothetical protein
VSLQLFKLATLSELDDGRIREAFDQAMQRGLADCKDRPADDRVRKITLEVSLVPLVSEKGDMETCDVAFKVAESLPKRISRTYNMKATAAGLVFNEDSPEDVRQLTLDQAPKPKKVGKNAS